MNEKKEEENEMREGRSGRVVPPGFRFHPTDEELLDFYLRKKVTTSKFELDHVISEVDLNKVEPWDLHEKCKVDASHQSEWYFFSHKDKKYPTGTRTNRATKVGFWKATGRDKPVLSSLSQLHQLAGQRIGMRKTLVFYRGRAPHGAKTDWIMHEYRLQDADPAHHNHAASKLTHEDGWVVCRVFKKKNCDEKSSSTSVSSTYYDSTNLSDEEQAPNRSTHTISTLLDVGSLQSILPAVSKPAQDFLKKQVQGINSLALPCKVGGKHFSLFSCKQEVMSDPYEGLSLNNLYQPTTPTFFQLPHLESTEIVSPNYRTINNIVSNPSFNTTHPSHGNEKRVDGSQKVPYLSHYTHNFEEGTITPHAGKAYVMTNEDLAHCMDSNNSGSGQHVAENIHCAGVCENFAQLHGTEALANFANDQLFSHFSGAHLSKLQAPTESYSSSYDIELWNFPR